MACPAPVLRPLNLGKKCVVACAFGLLTLGAMAGEQAQIDFANGLFSREFYEEAADEYRTYLNDYPGGEHRISALYRLGESEHAAKRYEAAIEAFDQLLAGEGPAELAQRARLRKGVALHRLERLDEAVKELKSASEGGTDDALRAEALYHLGKLHFEAGRRDEAIAVFKALGQQGGESPLVAYGRYQLAFIYLSQDALEKAAIEFSEIAASTEADEALRMECRFRAAEAYDKIGWFDAAVRAYEQLKTEFPGSEYARRAVYGHAWALYHAGKYDEALVGTRAFLNEFPDSDRKAGAAYLEGNCLQQQRKYGQAVKVYSAIREQYPGSEFARRAHYKSAWALYFGGQRDPAKQEIQAFLQDKDRLGLVGDAAFLLGTLVAAEGNYEDAYEEFRLVAEKYPDSEFAAEALYKSAECLAQLGHSEMAGQVFEEFARKWPENPLAGEAVLRAGDADFERGAFENSVAKYESILATPPGGKVEEETIYRLAIAYHNLKDYAASAKVFHQILEKYPKSAYAAEARLRIGDFLLRDGKKPLESLEYFKGAYKAVPQGPFAGRALKGLALARIETKDFDGAAEVFLRVIVEHDEVALNAETYAWVGQHLFDRQEWEQAALAFEALLRRVPEYPNPERVMLKIAQASQSMGDREGAIGRYTAVVEAAPKSTEAVEAKFSMAKLFEEGTRFDQAIRLYQDAANANSGDTAARARFRLGQLYENQGDYAAAAKSYMRVAILFLHEELSPESLWRAAQCFEKSEDRDHASRTYREVIEEYPESEQAQKAKARLEVMGKEPN